MSPLDVPIALSLIVAGLLVGGVVWLRLRREDQARGVQLDDAHPLARFGQCETTGCHYPATTEATHTTGPAWATSRRCTGCAAEGTAHGWWRTRLLTTDRDTVQA